jgi:hypothetical protein
MVPRKGRTVTTDDTHADEVTSAEEVQQASEAAAAERISRLLDPAAIDGLLADADAAGLSIDGPDGLINQMIKAVLLLVPTLENWVDNHVMSR